MKEFKKRAKLLCILLTALAMFLHTACSSDSSSGSDGGTEVYTVSFETNGGSEVKSLSVDEGKTIAKPADPVKEGFTFAGWFSDASLESEWDFGTAVKKNITLYAKWVEKTVETSVFTVTFDADNGSENTVKSVNENETVAAPENPSKDGFVFAGWYKGSVQYNFESPVTENLTLKAKWISESARTFTVTFDFGGDSKLSQIVEENGKVSEPEKPVKSGFTFEGWYLNAEKYDFSSPVTADIMLTAKWTQKEESKKFTVTFDPDNGSENEIKTVTEKDKVEAPAEPEKAGFKFAGWYKGTDQYDFESPVTEDITLKAKWISEADKTFTVSFDTGSESKIDTQTVVENEVAVLPKEPAKEGYTFKGWMNGNAEYDFKTPVTKDITLKAKWEINTYEVKFVVDGKDYGTVQTIKHGEKAEEPKSPTKEGSAFKGWLNGTAAYDFDTPVTGKLTLTAKWEINTYEVKFIVDGKEYGTVQTVKHGEKAEKPAAPAKEGSTFIGWLNGNAAYDFDTPVTGKLTLTAKWEINSYEVKFVVDGNDYGTVQTVNHGEKAEEPAAPTKEGSTFLGWLNGNNAYDFDTPVTGKLTLTAHWKVSTYEVKFLVDGEVYGEVQTIEYGSKVVKPADPKKSVTAFKSWQTDDGDYNFDTPVTGALTLTATWKENKFGITVTLESISNEPELELSYDENIGTFKATDGFTAYAWYIDGNPVEGSSSTFTVDDSNLPAGKRTVKVIAKDANGPHSAEAKVTVIK